MGNYDVDFESDNGYLSNLGGRAFMGAISPWFFTVSCCVSRCFLFYSKTHLLASALRSGIIQQELDLPIGRLAFFSAMGGHHRQPRPSGHR